MGQTMRRAAGQENEAPSTTRVLERNALAVKYAKAIGGRRTTYRLKRSQTQAERAAGLDAGIERGIELRVTPSGVGTWAFVYAKDVAGKRTVKRFVIGHRDSLTIEEVCDKAEKLRASILDGDPVAERKAARRAAAQPPPKTYTFKDLASDWSEQHDKPNNSPRRVRNNTLTLNKDVLPVIGHMAANEVTRKDIIALLNGVVRRGIDKARAKAKRHGEPDADVRGFKAHPNQVLALTRAIFRWGVREELVVNDPCQGVTPRVEQTSRDRVLTDDEVRTIWSKLPQTPLSRSVVLAIKLALVTGQRIGEVSGIAKAELDLSPGKSVWTIPGRRTKNAEPHRVPLSAMAVKLIEEALAASGDSPYLFPDATGKNSIDPHAGSKGLYWVRPQIGVSDWTIHDMRRTMATNLAMLGIEKHVVSLILNHVSSTGGRAEGVTAIYNRYSYDREKRQALELWANRLEAILKGKEPAADDNVIPFPPAVA
jgi:integrase